ncbi:chaperone protein DnaJ 49 [Tanacetum coccineum]
MAKDLWSLLAKWWDLDIPICANISEWYDWLDVVSIAAMARSALEGRNLVGFVVYFQKLLVVVVEIEKKLVVVVVVEKLVARVTSDLLIIMASKCLIIVSGCLAFCLVLGLVGVLPIYLTSLDPYSLGKDDLVYKHHLKTEQYGIDFYVKSGFDKKYPVGTRARAELEKRVINEYIEDNQRYCHRELSQRWYYGDINYPIPDCDDLKSKNITITPFFP